MYGFDGLANSAYGKKDQTNLSKIQSYNYLVFMSKKKPEGTEVEKNASYLLGCSPMLPSSFQLV